MIRKLLILCLFTFVFFSCKREKKVNSIIEEIKEKIGISQFNVETHLSNYEALKLEINKERKKTNLSDAKAQFATLLVDSIFKYWYKTPWDFNGHTTEPRNGEIACGYFVTTTLRDVGIKLKRIKLAQQASSVMIKELAQPKSVKRFAKLSNLENYLLNQAENSILIIGLDFHVGFVIKRNKKCYFIHSSYEGKQVVKSEILNESNPILNSKSYMIGNLTNNQKLMQQWISK